MSVSALGTEALISDSSEQSQACARWLLVRSKPLPARTWCLKWNRDTWTQHLSGRILRPSHTQSFVTAWTSSLEVTPASHSQLPENDSARTTPVTSGHTSQMELLSCDQGCASLRTSKDISAWGCPTSSKTWQEWVTERRGAYSARLKSGRRTRGNGCSSWPTANARDWKDSGSSQGMRTTPNLGTAVHRNGQAAQENNSMDGNRRELSVDWRTPQANEAGAKVETLYTKDGQPAKPGQRAYRKTPDGRMVLQSQTINQQVEMVQNWATPRANKTEGYSSPEFSPTLDQQVKSWATPDASDRRSDKSRQMGLSNQMKSETWPTPASSGVTGGPTGLAGGAGNREKLALMLPDAEAKAMGCGKLNPRWVETLMGLPVGWTMPGCASPVTIGQMS